MPAYEFEGVRPVVDPTAFVHPDAVLIGDVIVGAACFVGPGAILRGDLGRLVLEEGANVQDNCVLHTFPGRDVLVEAGGHVGHAAILHGCIVGRNAMVGMASVVMDEVTVSEGSLVAAMSFVKAGTVVPPGTLVAGVPAKVIRRLRPGEIDWKTRGTDVYRHLARRSRETHKLVEPLREVEPDRRRVPVIDHAPKSQAQGRKDERGGAADR
jgi:phenylacetic acid degradation protein